MSTTKWVLDPTHSEINFKVKHMMISNVSGSFTDMNAEMTSNDDQFNDAQIKFSAKIDSISTNNAQRDEHLKSAEFFNAEAYPELSFETTNYNASTGKLEGNLTLRGVTKPVTLDASFEGLNKDPWGNEKAGFSISGKISRSDFDLTWNAALETGGVLVSEEVKLNCEVQFVKQ